MKESDTHTGCERAAVTDDEVSAGGAAILVSQLRQDSTGIYAIDSMGSIVGGAFWDRSHWTNHIERYESSSLPGSLAD